MHMILMVPKHSQIRSDLQPNRIVIIERISSTMYTKITLEREWKQTKAVNDICNEMFSVPENAIGAIEIEAIRV